MAKKDEFDRLAALGAPGMAAYFVMAKLMRALRAKGVFSDMELAAICDAARDVARGQIDGEHARLAALTLQAISDLEQVVRGTLPSPSTH